LRDLFVKAFVSGIADPKHGRVRESEWRAAMVRLRDSIVYCQRCAAENFYDPDQLKQAAGKPGRCWSCSKEFTLPARIRIGKNVIMLNQDTKLYSHHVDTERQYDFSNAVAEVTQHPKDPKIWGLKNISGCKWVAILKDGDVLDVEPGKTVKLDIGTKVQFGTSEGEIRI
jgi:hypothetical protein